jgi:hypothetical protein
MPLVRFDLRGLLALTCFGLTLGAPVQGFPGSAPTSSLAGSWGTRDGAFELRLGDDGSGWLRDSSMAKNPAEPTQAVIYEFRWSPSKNGIMANYTAREFRSKAGETRRENTQVQREVQYQLQGDRLVFAGVTYGRMMSTRSSAGGFPGQAVGGAAPAAAPAAAAPAPAPESLVMPPPRTPEPAARPAPKKVSLRERIQRRRAKTELKADLSIRLKKAGLRSDMTLLEPPEPGPELWQIHRFHQPVPKIFGTPMGQPGESRFHAKLEGFEGDARETYELETPVIFYEYVDGKLHLAGRGEVAKIRGVAGKGFVLEAKILSFRHATKESKKAYNPKSGGMYDAMVPELVAGKSPETESWWMSTEFQGSDVFGWEQEERSNFHNGKLWMGMPETAMGAIFGWAPSSDAGGDRRVYQYGPSKILVQAGLVVGAE